VLIGSPSKRIRVHGIQTVKKPADNYEIV
jgi:hypothetical protein